MDSKDRWLGATREACSRLAAKSYHILLCSNNEFKDHSFWFSLILGVGDCLFVFVLASNWFLSSLNSGQELSGCVGLESGRWRTLKAQTLCFRGHKVSCHPVFTEHQSLVRNPSNSSHRTEAFRIAVAVAWSSTEANLSSSLDANS